MSAQRAIIKSGRHGFARYGCSARRARRHTHRSLPEPSPPTPAPPPSERPTCRTVPRWGHTVHRAGGLDGARPHPQPQRAGGQEGARVDNLERVGRDKLLRVRSEPLVQQRRARPGRAKHKHRPLTQGRRRDGAAGEHPVEQPNSAQRRCSPPPPPPARSLERPLNSESVTTSFSATAGAWCMCTHVPSSHASHRKRTDLPARRMASTSARDTCAGTISRRTR